MRRSILILAVISLLAAGAVTAFLLTNADDDVVDQPEGAGSSSPEPPSPSLVFVEGTTLKQIDPGIPPRTLLSGVPLTASAADAGPWLSWVETVDPKEPVLHLYNLETEEETEIEGASVPTWNAAGDQVAVAMPQSGARCQHDECKGDVVIAVLDPETGDEHVVLGGADEWLLKGWAGEDLLVATPENEEETISRVTMDGEITVLEVPSIEFSSASPDGEWLISSSPRGMELYSLDQDGAEYAETLGEREEQYVQADWSDDSTEVAMVLQGQGGARVVTFQATDPEFIEVEGSDEAAGRIFWAPQGGLVLTRLDTERTVLEAVYCASNEDDDCEGLLEWSQAVVVYKVV